MNRLAVRSLEPVAPFSIVLIDTAPRLSNIFFPDVAAAARYTYMRP